MLIQCVTQLFLALKICVTAVEHEELSPLDHCWESQLRLSGWALIF